MHKRVIVNQEQTRRMADRLKELAQTWQRTSTNLPASVPDDIKNNPTAIMDYFFFTSMLLFDFKGMEITLPDGRSLKGTDVFYYLARHAGGSFWTATHLATISETNFNRAFSLAHNPASPDVIRMPERLMMVQDAARLLNEHYQGTAAELFRQNPALRTESGSGLLDRVLAFKGYSDPLFKKLFVCLKALDAMNIWKPRDPENILLPVDYHVIRLALRNGIITVEDKALVQKLHEKQPATPEDEQDIRAAVAEAGQELVKNSGLSVFLIDEIYWLIGRSCCHYARPPRCATCDFTDCSVQPAFQYTCPGKCPLATHCSGAQDEHHRRYFEPNIVTTYY